MSQPERMMINHLIPKAGTYADTELIREIAGKLHELAEILLNQKYAYF